MANMLYWRGQGKTLTVTYDECKHPKPASVDTRSGDEIAEDIIKRAGLILKE